MGNVQKSKKELLNEEREFNENKLKEYEVSVESTTREILTMQVKAKDKEEALEKAKEYDYEDLNIDTVNGDIEWDRAEISEFEDYTKDDAEYNWKKDKDGDKNGQTNIS